MIIEFKDQLFNINLLEHSWYDGYTVWFIYSGKRCWTKDVSQQEWNDLKLKLIKFTK